MKYLSVSMLAEKGRNESPSENVIRGILSLVEAEVNNSVLTKVITEPERKDLPEVTGARCERLVPVPVGGAGGGGGVGAGGLWARLTPEEKPLQRPRRRGRRGREGGESTGGIKLGDGE